MAKSITCSLILLLTLFCSAVHARSESEIKIVYLYNFIKFITWPQESNSDNINICIYGKNTFGQALFNLNKLKARNKSIEIIFPSLDEDADCAVIFIGPSDENISDKLLTNISNKPVLTVSEINSFITKGGMIGFIKLGNVVSFDINLQQARSSNIQISSKLLELANLVIQ